MTQIGIHDDNEITICMFYAMNVGRSQAQFWGSWTQQDLVFAINLLQLLGNVLCAVRTAIVDDNYLEFDFTADENGKALVINYVALFYLLKCCGHTFHSCIWLWAILLSANFPFRYMLAAKWNIYLLMSFFSDVTSAIRSQTQHAPSLR